MKTTQEIEEKVKVELVTDGKKESEVKKKVADFSGQVDCLRCPSLKEELKEKNLRIQELETELESKSQRIQELSQKLAEAETGNSKVESEDQRTADIAQNGINTLLPTEGHSVFSAVVNGKSKEEIESLVEMGEDWTMRNNDEDTVLHVAARTGNYEVVKYFISIGAEVDARNVHSYTPLMEAARTKENFVQVVDNLIRGGADLKATNKVGDNALFIALKAGKTAKEVQPLCFENYLTTKNDDDWHKNTALHVAAMSGNLDALTFFISQKPGVNVKSGFGRTPIMSAASAEENYSSIVDLLVRNGADINARDYNLHNSLYFAIAAKKPVSDLKKLVDLGAEWYSPRILSFCIKHEYSEAVKYFIGEGADIYGPDDWRWAPLMKAAKREMTEVMDILIEKGGSHERGRELLSCKLEIPDIPGKKRWTPTVEALEKLSKAGVTWDSTVIQGFASDGNLEGIRYCMTKGEDVGGGSSLLYSAVTGANPRLEVLDFLINMGENVNERTMWGFSRLHSAAENPKSSLAIIKKLVSSGATWNNELLGGWENRKQSVLHAAARGGRPEVVQYFISNGADVNCRDNYYGYTPFLFAVRDAGTKFWPEVLRVLVNSGADPKVLDNQGNNAFKIGLNRLEDYQGHLTLEHLKFLISLGCDWRAPNKNGFTFLRGLKNMGKLEILEYFESLD